MTETRVAATARGLIMSYIHLCLSAASSCRCFNTHHIEIGDALSAFEQQRQQNASLLQQLTERDATLSSLKAEKLAAQQQLEVLTEQVCVCGACLCVGGLG